MNCVDPDKLCLGRRKPMVSTVFVAAVVSVALAGCLGTARDAAPQWNPGERTGFLVRHVVFPDSDTGYVAGDADTVLRSIDGGRTWTRLPVGPAGIAFVSALHFRDGARGWMAGSGGALLRTTDAGASWAASAPAEYIVRGIWFTDTLLGFAAGDFGMLLRSTDGGASWGRIDVDLSVLPEETMPLTVRFSGPDTGLVAGMENLLLRTTDGGRTWSRIEVDTTALRDFYDVFFASSRVVYLAAAGSGFGSVYRSEDAGGTWEKVGAETIASQGLLSLHFDDTARGWAAGDFGDVFATRDGGESWRREATPVEGNLRAIAFARSGSGIAAGDDGRILVRDGFRIRPGF